MGPLTRAMKLRSTAAGTWLFRALLVGLVFAAAASGTAQAGSITFLMDYEFSGGTPPEGTPPWLAATFDDDGTAGSVVMTLTTTNLPGTEFVREWYFNLDPTLDPTDLAFSAPTKTGTFADPTVSTGTDAFKADGDGNYDILVAFDNAPPANRFTAGDAVEYTITGIGSLTAASFNFLSAPAGGHGPYLTAAHVQGIGEDGEDSGWVTTPEPATVALVAGGLAWIALLKKRRPRARKSS